MHKFTCAKCDSRIFFDNQACLACGSPVGFAASDLSMVTLRSEAEIGRAHV